MVAASASWRSNSNSGSLADRGPSAAAARSQTRCKVTDPRSFIMSASGLARPASSLLRLRYPVARSPSASASSDPSSAYRSWLSPAPCAVRTESSPRFISTQFMIQIIWRSWCNEANATFHPPLTGPSRLSAGTSTSSRKTSQNVSSEIDDIRMGSIRTPGAVRSRIRHEMPRCLGASGSVRTYRVHQRDSWA